MIAFEKAWWKSKTLWLNFVAFVAIILQVVFGFVLPAEIQAAIITLVNFVLRLISDKEIVRRED